MGGARYRVSPGKGKEEGCIQRIALGVTEIDTNEESTESEDNNFIDERGLLGEKKMRNVNINRANKETTKPGENREKHRSKRDRHEDNYIWSRDIDIHQDKHNSHNEMKRKTSNQRKRQDRNKDWMLEDERKVSLAKDLVTMRNEEETE